MATCKERARDLKFGPLQLDGKGKKSTGHIVNLHVNKSSGGAPAEGSGRRYSTNSVLSPMSRWDVGVDVSSGRCVKVVCALSLPADVLWNIIHILDVRVLYKYMYASGRVSYRYGALLKYTTTQASETDASTV